MALCFLSQGPLQFISSKHIQKKRNEEEGAGKTESEVFVTIISKRFSWLETSHSASLTHAKRGGDYTGCGPGVRDQKLAAAHTNSLPFQVALMLNVTNTEADCVG